MPYTAASGSAAGGSATFQLTLSASVTSGDALVVAASSNAAASAPASCADSKGNSYTRIVIDTNRSPNVAFFVALNCAAMTSGVDTVTVTFGGTAAQKCMIVRGSSGIATAFALDQVPLPTDALSSSSPSVGPTNSLFTTGEWAIAALADATAGGTPSSWTGGFTAVTTTGAGPFLTVADQVAPSRGSLTAGASITAATFTMAMVVLSPQPVPPAALNGLGTLTATGVGAARPASGSGAVSMAVTATQGGATANGLLMRVLVVVPGASLQNGATFSGLLTATASFTAPVTANAGSDVYGVAARTGPTDASTGVAATIIDDFPDVPNSGRYVTHASYKVPAGAVTRGHQSLVNESAVVALAEIRPVGASLSQDASAPAVAVTTAATTVTTPVFTPPRGALLVALVSSDGGGGVTTITVTSSGAGGVTWAELVKRNDAGHGYAGIWLGQVPYATGTSFTGDPRDSGHTITGPALSAIVAGQPAGATVQ